MHPAIIIGIFRSLIVDVAMGQIPRSTERISSYHINLFIYLFIYSSIHINNKKIKTFNVHILAVWTKWQTLGQATYVSP